MKVARDSFAAFAALSALAACQPPATDNYIDRRSGPDQLATQPGIPLSSPNTDGAVWAETEGGERLLYGKPGEHPLFALGCIDQGGLMYLQFTRYAPADQGAKAFMALIGNGHVARLKVDASAAGAGMVWQGSTPIENDRLEVLTGKNAVEATIPGAGTLRLNASNAPARLIDACRSAGRSTPNAAPVPPANPE